MTRNTWILIFVVIAVVVGLSNVALTVNVGFLSACVGYTLGSLSAELVKGIVKELIEDEMI